MNYQLYFLVSHDDLVWKYSGEYMQKKHHILKFKQLNSACVPYPQKTHMKEKLCYCLLVFFRANVLLFPNTKPFSLLLFECESCCWGMVLLYQVGWAMFWLARSMAVVWFGFTWGHDPLTGKQTCVIPAESWSRSLLLIVLLIQCITGFHSGEMFMCGNTQLLGGHLGCWGQQKCWCQWPWELVN